MTVNGRDVGDLIYLYTEKQDSDEWILKNDLYFNLYTGNQPLTQEDKEIIKKIDNAEVTDGIHIQTKYGLGTIRNFSSGCKTYLNVIKNPDKIISAKEAILKVKEYAEQGYTYAVVLDLSKYFDTINHEILINLLRKNVKDERVVQLIKRYLKSGVMENGVVIDTEEGSPQGGEFIATTCKYLPQ